MQVSQRLENMAQRSIDTRRPDQVQLESAEPEPWLANKVAGSGRTCGHGLMLRGPSVRCDLHRCQGFPPRPRAHPAHVPRDCREAY